MLTFYGKGNILMRRIFTDNTLLDGRRMKDIRTFFRHTANLYISMIILGISLNTAVGQGFGKNKVQYSDFRWEYIQSKHFDVYFTEGGREIADFAATAAESAYVTISYTLRWDLQKRISLIIYNSHNDFQSTNVSLGYLYEGIGGFTELFKNRIVLPWEGSYKEFKSTLHHELVHAMVNDLVYGGSIQSVVSGRVSLNIPLWFGEGFAEYSSDMWDSRADMFMRDLAVNAKVRQRPRRPARPTRRQ